MRSAASLGCKKCRLRFQRTNKSKQTPILLSFLETTNFVERLVSSSFSGIKSKIVGLTTLVYLGISISEVAETKRVCSVWLIYQWWMTFAHGNQLQWFVKFIQNQGFICSKSTSVNMISNTSWVPIKTAGGLLKFLISVSIECPPCIRLLYNRVPIFSKLAQFAILLKELNIEPKEFQAVTFLILVKS
jgi:hypothetical protein